MSTVNTSSAATLTPNMLCRALADEYAHGTITLEQAMERGNTSAKNIVSLAQRTVICQNTLYKRGDPAFIDDLTSRGYHRETIQYLCAQMPQNHGKTWSADDISALNAYLRGERTLQDVSEALGRSPGSIQAGAKKQVMATAEYKAKQTLATIAAAHGYSMDCVQQFFAKDARMEKTLADVNFDAPMDAGTQRCVVRMLKRLLNEGKTPETILAQYPKASVMLNKLTAHAARKQVTPLSTPDASLLIQQLQNMTNVLASINDKLGEFIARQDHAGGNDLGHTSGLHSDRGIPPMRYGI